MRSLFIGSVSERSGKTILSLGLAKNAPGKVGYFKPFKETIVYAKNRILDQDAYLMKKVLNLEAEEEIISPCSYDVFRPVSMNTMLECWDKLREGCDTMIVEGTRDITTGYIHDVSGPAIAQAIGADMVLVGDSSPGALDKIAVMKHLLGDYNIDFKGAILNMADDPAVEVFLEEKGINVLGSIPSINELKRFRVKEVVESLGAEVVVGDENLDRPVEDVMVGAMTPESAIKYMRRVGRKALITGGDRSDIQMAALSTDTSCLILTGGLYPVKTVVSKAYEKGVPILLVRYDTLTAAEMVEHLIARIDPEDEAKIKLISETVKNNINLDELWGEV
ncbi:MAG: AAA family ATPase [Methanomassiliicoccales archaeon]|nr:AAA family ATPase [Methanomassiliicoccales archaeon]NYT14593.1 AAA family ATPase [Methanomassiliicoccales archaeon]